MLCNNLKTKSPQYMQAEMKGRSKIDIGKQCKENRLCQEKRLFYSVLFTYLHSEEEYSLYSVNMFPRMLMT